METVVGNEYKNQLKAKPLSNGEVVESHFKDDVIQQVKTKAVETYDSSLSAIRRSPIKSLAIALGVGVGLGLVSGYFLKRP